ncbi:MAG: radical SAM protein [Methylocystis sp.]|nr:radical SAM protein [Methylocystis sp.]
MTSSQPLEVTRNLISIERGEDELLLINSFYMQPLYVARGRDFFKQLLSRLPRARALGELKSDFPESAKVIELLRDYHILISPSTDKERFTPSEMADISVAPRTRDRMTAYLLLTEFCNLSCAYCLNGSDTYLKNKRSRMTPDTAIRSLITCLDQLNPGGQLEVAFFGGEPLLNWDGIKEVIRRCENELKQQYPEKRISYHLTSNLTVCPPDLIEYIRDYNIAVVSDIDGPAEIHDRVRPHRNGKPSHWQTADTVRRLTDAGLPVALRATVSSLNEDRIPEVAAHHKELGAVSSAIVPMSPINSDGDFIPIELLPNPDKLISGLIQAYRSGIWAKGKLFPFDQYIIKLRPGGRQVKACSAPSGTMPVVRVNGDVYVCIYLVGQAPYRFGSLEGSWDPNPLTEMARSLHVDGVPVCQDCAWRYACGGGCPVMSLSQSERKNGPVVAEYIRRIKCDFTQAILVELLWDTADAAKAGLSGNPPPSSEATADIAHNC